MRNMFTWFILLATTCVLHFVVGSVTKATAQDQSQACVVQSQEPVKIIFDESKHPNIYGGVGKETFQIINNGNIMLQVSLEGKMRKEIGPNESVKYLVPKNTSLTLSAGTYAHNSKMLPGSTSVSGFIQLDGPTTMTFAGNNGNWYIVEKTIRGMATTFLAPKDADGNSYESDILKNCDPGLPDNEVKSVRVGNEDIQELAFYSEPLKSYYVFVATPTISRERLHEIASHYNKQFGINPDQEGEARNGSLTIFYYPTPNNFPRKIICKLLKDDKWGIAPVGTLHNVRSMANKSCNGKYFLAFFGKGRVTDMRWRRLITIHSDLSYCA